jgi:hypothetical protein
LARLFSKLASFSTRSLPLARWPASPTVCSAETPFTPASPLAAAAKSLAELVTEIRPMALLTAVTVLPALLSAAATEVAPAAVSVSTT